MKSKYPRPGKDDRMWKRCANCKNMIHGKRGKPLPAHNCDSIMKALIKDMKEYKNCPTCNSKIYRKESATNWNWERRKYCNNRCQYLHFYPVKGKYRAKICRKCRKEYVGYYSSLFCPEHTTVKEKVAREERPSLAAFRVLGDELREQVKNGAR